MSYEKQIQSLLKNFIKEVSDIKTIVIGSVEGLLISELGSNDFWISSKSSALLNAVREFGSNLNCDDLNEIIIYGRNSYAILLPNSYFLILAVIQYNVELNEILPELRGLVNKLDKVI